MMRSFVCGLALLLVMLTSLGQAWANHTTAPFANLHQDSFNVGPVNDSGQSTSSFSTQLRETLNHEIAGHLAAYSSVFVSRTQACLHDDSEPSAPGKTSDAFACEAFVPEHILQTSTAIAYQALDADVCWAIISSDNNGITGWDRTGSTGYYSLCEGDTTPNQPVLPANSAWLMQVTTSGGGISAVLDLRKVYPDGVNHAERFASFAAIIDEFNDAGDPDVTIAVSSRMHVTATVTVTTNIHLRLSAGALFDIDSGVTLTLPSPESLAGGVINQIFTGSGSVRFTIGGTVYIDWWWDGSDGDGAVQAAFDSLTGVSGTIIGADRTYAFNAIVNIPTTGSFRWRNQPTTTYQAAAGAGIDTLIGLEKVALFDLDDGIFDANGQSEWLINTEPGDGFDVPDVLKIRNVEFKGNGGTVGVNNTGGAIIIVATGSADVREILIENNTFDGITNTEGDALGGQGFNTDPNLRVELINNRISNYQRGPHIDECDRCVAERNIITNIQGDAITLRGLRVDFDTAGITTLDPKRIEGIVASFNVINQKASTGGTGGGIIIGKGAAPVTVSFNQIYGNGSSGVGISIDAALGPTQPTTCSPAIFPPTNALCGGAYETKAMVIGNTVVDFNLGMANNGTHEYFINNIVTDSVTLSLTYHGNSAGFAGGVWGNIFDGAQISIGDVGSGQDSQPFDARVYGNFFYNIPAGDSDIIEEPGGGASTWGTRKPISVQRATGDISIASIAADVWDFDTTSGAITTSFPFTQQVEIGQYLTVMHSAGGNSITLNTLTRTFTNANVDTGTDIITLTDTIFAEWNNDGVAVRLDAGGNTLPTGLAENTIYYLILVTGDQVKLATTLANAIAGTQIDITGAGTGPWEMGDLFYAHNGEQSFQDVIADHSTVRKYLSGHGAWFEIGTNGGQLTGTVINMTSASIAANVCGDYGTITVTGVTFNNAQVVIATPDDNSMASGIEESNLSWSAYVSAANTVTVRACNPTGGAIDLGNTQEWRAVAFQY